LAKWPTHDNNFGFNKAKIENLTKLIKQRRLKLKSTQFIALLAQFKRPDDPYGYTNDTSL
jgi:hypothetical protein